jgi:hypothetical protein
MFVVLAFGKTLVGFGWLFMPRSMMVRFGWLRPLASLTTLNRKRCFHRDQETSISPKPSRVASTSWKTVNEVEVATGRFAHVEVDRQRRIKQVPLNSLAGRPPMGIERIQRSEPVCFADSQEIDDKLD